MSDVIVACLACGKQKEVESRTKVTTCGSCGALIECEKVTRTASVSSETSSVSQPVAAQVIDESKLSETVRNWKTSYGWACAGIVVSYMVSRMPMDWIQTVDRYLLMCVATFAVPFVYAIIIYPKYFDPAAGTSLSNSAISFWNCAFGGLIFGCLWNSCLTRKRIGISHIVMMVLIGVLTWNNISLVL